MRDKVKRKKINYQQFLEASLNEYLPRIKAGIIHKEGIEGITTIWARVAKGLQSKKFGIYLYEDGDIAFQDKHGNLSFLNTLTTSPKVTEIMLCALKQGHQEGYKKWVMERMGPGEGVAIDEIFAQLKKDY